MLDCNNEMKEVIRNMLSGLALLQWIYAVRMVNAARTFRIIIAVMIH